MGTTPDITFSRSEVARYARLRPATVRAWLTGNLGVGEQNAEEVNFYEFIQLIAVAELRERGISLKKISETIKYVREKCGIAYPLASNKHHTFTEGRELYLMIDGENGVFTATGILKEQLNSQEIVGGYQKKLEFDEEGMASKYFAFCKGDETVSISPAEYYGQPIVAGTPYTVTALANAAVGEGSAEAAAEVYQVDFDKIEVAVAYIAFLEEKISPPGKAA